MGRRQLERAFENSTGLDKQYLVWGKVAKDEGEAMIRVQNSRVLKAERPQYEALGSVGMNSKGNDTLNKS
jgi:hypothetical protein